MRLRTLFLALAAGIATTLLVGAAVTEALLPTIEFSALVGLPLGLAAGFVVGSLVLILLAGRDTATEHRHAATAVGVAGIVLLAVFGLAVFLLGQGAMIGLIVGAVVGLAAGAGTFVWLARSGEQSVHAVTPR